MSNRNIDVEKNKLSFQTITTSDTISQFMEKVNNNFSKIAENNGGPIGETGEKGDQGVPTKPKVPIHAWKKGNEYEKEIEDNNNFYIENIKNEELTNTKYQEGHLIMLENGHVYILELTKDFILNPKFLIAVQSFDPNSVIDGKTAYVHIAYAEDIINGIFKNFITDQQLRNGEIISNPNELSTYNILNSDSDSDFDIIYSNNMMYIGIYSDNEETSPQSPYRYTWFKIREYDYNFSLSNPISTIIVDENNCCVNNIESSTSLFLYKNNLEISKENNISIILENDNGHFITRKNEQEINEIVFNPFKKNSETGKPDTPFKFDSDSYNLHIILENENKTYKKTIDWTLIPIKFSVVKVFVDKNIINTSISKEQTINVGYYSISQYKKEIIDKKDENYDIILTDNFEDYSNNKTNYVKLQEWDNVKYYFIDENGKNKTCYVILVDKNNNIIDYTTITTINDGYSMSLDLTEDHFTLPYNIDHTGIHEDYHNISISSQILLYNNDKLIDNLTDYTYSFYKVNQNQFDEDITSDIAVDDNGNINIPFYFIKDIKDNTKIKCVNENFQLQKTIYIDFKETPYKLELEKYTLTRGTNNQINEDNIKVYLKYYIDNSWKVSKESNITIKASWINDDDSTITENENFIFNSIEGYYYMNINSEKFKDIKNIKISCVKDDNELFSETIVILNDGKNGTTEKLDTNPNGNNKVSISDNNIIITDDEGKELVNISSDVVNNTGNKLYTQIGKDGISIKQIGDEEKCIFTVSNNEILMQIGEYGIKITNSGITKIEPNLEPNII